MAWQESIVEVLKKYRIRFINYVPDAKNARILELTRNDPHFQMVPLAREEEGVGIASGQAVGGQRGVLMMPTAGLGNSINALASLPIAYKIPLPMFVGVRGDLGEFNQAQVGMGQAMPDILKSLGIPTYRITREEDAETITDGALRICYANESPVAILLTNEMAGWKKGKTYL